MSVEVLSVYQGLLTLYGDPEWWPADNPFEVMIGAILTQNTAWAQVERTITQLRARNCLTPEQILASEPALLETWLKSTGYYRQKALRLRNYCEWYLAHGGLEELEQWPTPKLRAALLSVQGIGPETADDILLYALGRPIFIIDAYTRRLAERLGWTAGGGSYHHWQRWFMEILPKDASFYHRYHALIVVHAKQRCRKRQPRCEGCTIQKRCHYPKIQPTS